MPESGPWTQNLGVLFGRSLRNLPAVYAARSVTGVRSVRNELKVETRIAAKS